MPRSPIAERNEHICRLYREGWSHAEIGVKFYISAATVKGVCRNIVREQPSGIVCRHCGADCGTQELCTACTVLVQVGPKELLPCQPTNAAPGSDDKIRVLRLRLERGERLYHPDDCAVLANREGGAPKTIGEKRLSKMESFAVSTCDHHVVRKAIS